MFLATYESNIFFFFFWYVELVPTFISTFQPHTDVASNTIMKVHLQYQYEYIISLTGNLIYS